MRIVINGVTYRLGVNECNNVGVPKYYLMKYNKQRKGWIYTGVSCDTLNGMAEAVRGLWETEGTGVRNENKNGNRSRV